MRSGNGSRSNMRKGRTDWSEAMRAYERNIMLNIIDSQWKDHLLSLDHVKQGIGLGRLRAKGSAGRIQETEF